MTSLESIQQTTAKRKAEFDTRTGDGQCQVNFSDRIVRLVTKWENGIRDVFGTPPEGPANFWTK